MDLLKLCMNQLRRITFSKSSFIPNLSAGPWHCKAMDQRNLASHCVASTVRLGVPHFRSPPKNVPSSPSTPWGIPSLKYELRKTALNIPPCLIENEPIFSHLLPVCLFVLDLLQNACLCWRTPLFWQEEGLTSIKTPKETPLNHHKIPFAPHFSW